MARVPTHAWVSQFLVKGERSIFCGNLCFAGARFGSATNCKNVAAAAGASAAVSRPSSPAVRSYGSRLRPLIQTWARHMPGHAAWRF